MYLDPGFGGMLIQIAVALVAVGGAVIFAMRRKIKVIFSNDKSKNIKEDAAKNSADTSADDAIDILSDD